MSAFEAALAAVQADLPENILAVDHAPPNLEVVFATPSDTYVLMLPDGYAATYPRGEVSAMIGVNFEELGEGELRPVLEKFAAMVARHHGALNREYTSMSYGSYEEQEDMEDDFSYGADSILDRPMHPQLATDLEKVHARYGADAVTIEEHKRLDEVVCSLELNVQYLPASVCHAWGLAPKVDCVPLTVKVTVSRSGYTDVKHGTVACSQRGRQWCGLAGQLNRILQPFLNAQLAGGGGGGGTWPDEVAQLVAMGFPAHRCRAALHISDGKVAAATALLVENADCLDQVTLNTKGTQNEKKDDAPDPAKLPPPRTDGLLVQIMDYAHQRIPTSCSYCVICDEKHAFNSRGLLKASVCRGDLCAFAFQQLGLGSDAAQDLAIEAGVVDLLVTMAKAAAKSGRWELIFNPYPTLFDPNDASKKILNASKKDIEKVRAIMKAFPAIKALSDTGSTMDANTKMHDKNPHATPLLNWIISSNPSHLLKISKDERLKVAGTPHQYILLSTSPEKQAEFDALKRQHKTVFAFHGSAVENWHSIFRNGLYNASGTNLQVNGAAYGSGIYLSPCTTVSYGYSQMSCGDGPAGGARPPRQGSDEWLGEDVKCIAICECIDKDIKKSRNIWVQPHSSHVVTRFFLVFDSVHQPSANLNSEDSSFDKDLRKLVKLYCN